MSNFGLVGEDIKNSRSPILYKSFDEDILYDLFDSSFTSEKEKYVLEILRKLRTGEISGINITHPWKSFVANYIDKKDISALILNAVNTVISKNGILVGYNTDVYGFKAAYSDFLEDGKTLILGRGGAARAVILALKDYDLTIYVRDNEKNDELLKIKSDLKFINSFKDRDFTNVINATDVGFNEYRTILDRPFYSQKTAIDIIYTPIETLFLRLMRESGVKTTNGYDMLYFQAKQAYEIFMRGY